MELGGACRVAIIVVVALAAVSEIVIPLTLRHTRRDLHAHTTNETPHQRDLVNYLIAPG